MSKPWGRGARVSAQKLRFGVFGAGAIGCYLGGELAAAGEDVLLVGRASLREELSTHGFTLTDYHGARVSLSKEQLAFATDATALRDRDVVLVTVKSGDSAEAARTLAPVLSPGTVVVSFQNGVRNADVLRAGLPAQRVLAGMVAFNVVRKGQGQFHRGTSGPLVVERANGAERPIVGALRAAGFETESARDVRRVQWAKLLLNLNNAVNALSGVPLREELSDRRYRRVLAACMREGLLCARANGVSPAAISGVPSALIPSILELPNAIFERVARAMLAVDPEARSSMWEDLERRRPTELDALNGEIVSLCERSGLDAPANRAICTLVRKAEGAAQGSPRMSASTLLDALDLRPVKRASWRGAGGGSR